ncbi:MAG: cytochrome P460 family protein [Nitrospira sp.]|nr:cytochrome P460 family protein [Nitrospira sp.]
MIRRMASTVAMGVAVFAIAACVAMQAGSAPKDGEVALPADYKSWPVCLKEVQKPDAVRDLYVNPVGSRTAQGQMVPNGTQFVMEIYSGKKAADGIFEKDAAGKLVKDKLAKVFVMGKGEGWGQDVPDNVKTGAWVYAAYGPDAASEGEFCRVPGLPCAAGAEGLRPPVRRVFRETERPLRR